MQSAIVVVILENEHVDDKKIVVVRKIEKVIVVSGSLRLQKTELQDLQLGARHCDVRGLTLVTATSGIVQYRPI